MKTVYYDEMKIECEKVDICDGFIIAYGDNSTVSSNLFTVPEEKLERVRNLLESGDLIIPLNHIKYIHIASKQESEPEPINHHELFAQWYENGIAPKDMDWHLGNTGKYEKYLIFDDKNDTPLLQCTDEDHCESVENAYSNYYNLCKK